jgi:hypothetical protein
MAAGFSGHGFMHSPVIGELLAEWLIGGAPSLDLSALRLERFEAEASAHFNTPGARSLRPALPATARPAERG